MDTNDDVHCCILFRNLPGREPSTRKDGRLTGHGYFRISLPNRKGSSIASVEMGRIHSAAWRFRLTEVVLGRTNPEVSVRLNCNTDLVVPSAPQVARL